MENELQEKLFTYADEKYKKFQQALCPNTDNIIGVRVPILRKIAKEITKQDFRQYLKTAKDDYYEEIMIQGLVISLSKMELSEKLEYTEKFIPKINNWAVCDIFCSSFKCKKNQQEIIWKFINKYLKSSKEFEVRFAIVMMISNFIDEEYIDRVINILDKIKSNKYYVQMAIAWAISICYIKYKDKTEEYLKSENNLSDTVFNKSIQKIIESNRVSQEDKNKLRKMKR